MKAALALLLLFSVAAHAESAKNDDLGDFFIWISAVLLLIAAAAIFAIPFWCPL